MLKKTRAQLDLERSNIRRESDKKLVLKALLKHIRIAEENKVTKRKVSQTDTFTNKLHHFKKVFGFEANQDNIAELQSTTRMILDHVMKIEQKLKEIKVRLRNLDS